MKTVKLLPSAKKCIVTSDRKLLPKIEMFDALLFSGQHPWSVEKSFPKYRSSEQFYVFVDLECPPMSAHKFASDPNRELYNLTMTYRRDSDIYWPYGFIAKDNVKYLSEAEEPQWMEPVFDDAEEIDPTLLQSIETKHKTAAWFVSNCHAQSNRNELAHAMQKTIDVDIYGKCGPLVCPRSKTGECYDHVEQEYFFYLSFENNLCNDYVTEKVFSIMRYNIVPVVYGGANYSQHLPPHSYIDANDFTTATDLANYLNYLRENIKEYVKFFWWKKYYKTIFSGKVYNNLCDKLHELTSSGNERNATFYEDIETWWTKDQCSKKKQKIKFI
uniref:Fucosyltransferase n=2 Tax=Lutzomyia longipalpis TaxID=7200 RepID=A0A1B0C8E1_LUTLO